MRNRPAQFTMRRQGVPQKGDWFTISKPRDAVAGEADGDYTEVYIYDEIGYWGTSAQDFATQLMGIKTKYIDLHLNTPGGDMFDGLAIYNSLKNHNAEVTTYIDGLAASAGSFIALSAEKVIMARNASFMIHDASAIAYGNEADFLEMAQLLGGFSDNIADIYSQQTGIPVEECRALMKAETWMTGKEALQLGFVDEVTDLDEELEDDEQPENKWDLSVFQHAGRSHADSPFRLRERVRLMNNAKETGMGNSPKNEGGTGTPAEQSGQQDPGEHESEDTGTGSPDTDENAETGEGTETAPGAEPNTSQPENKAGMVEVVVNGLKHKVPAAVATHLRSLETFQTETVENVRSEKVKALASAGKIDATDIESVTAWALTLSDEQYDTWATTMGKAPASPLFGEHGPSNTGGSPQTQADAQVTQEIADLENIVANHRRAGMSEETLKTKASYKRLQELKQNQTQQN